MVVNFLITTRLSMPVVLVALAVASHRRLVADRRHLGARPADLGPLRRRHAQRRPSRCAPSNSSPRPKRSAARTLRILLTEIAPNVMNHLIVVATLEMAHAILLEAALSFLGLGVQPPTPSWGLMISEAKGLMYLRSLADHHPGRCAVRARAVDQSRRRRPARRDRTREPELDANEKNHEANERSHPDRRGTCTSTCRCRPAHCMRCRA